MRSFLIFPLNNILLNEKSETTENVRNNKVKVKPALYSLEMKLLKFEYIPLNVSFDTQIY